jgi:hypothetical protein
MKSSCCFSLRSLRSALRLCAKPLVILNPFFHGRSGELAVLELPDDQGDKVRL